MVGPDPQFPTQRPGPRYPGCQVKLVGLDGNAFAIIGRVLTTLKAHGVSTKERDEFLDEAKSGDYDHLLQTVMKWVKIS